MLNDYVLDKMMRQNVRDQHQQAARDDRVQQARHAARGSIRRPSLLGRLGITINIVVRRANA